MLFLVGLEAVAVCVVVANCAIVPSSRLGLV